MIKKTVKILIAIILTVIIFTGCKPLFPVDYDEFDLGDTVKVHVGEKVYECENFWIRVDSLQDGRCPIGLDCFWAGEAKVWLSISYNDSIQQCYFSTFFDSLQTYDLIFNDVPEDYFEISMVEVNPYPVYGVTPLARNIWVSFSVSGMMSIDRKPNLYLYPETKTKVDVMLEFPHGGKVTESDPFYPLKWKGIKVKPNGTIDRKYGFLFYECEIPDLWQYSEGWVIALDDLEAFFRKNLKDYGFNAKEIEDFIEFWIPELNNSPYYEIYPQYTEMVNRVIKLKISPYPDAKLRLHYVIRESEKAFDLPVPEIPVFERHGFTVAEWGVVIQ